MTIIIRNPENDKFTPVGSNNFKKIQNSLEHKGEKLLEDLFVESKSLTTNDSSEPIRLCILSRQYQTMVGSLDIMAVDEDGSVYIIETKLQDNSDRRAVIAQVLDYGASLCQNGTFQKWLDDFEKDKKKTLEEFLISDEIFSENDENQIKDIIHSIKNCFEDGNFKFVLVFDKLDDRLKNIIDFINKKNIIEIYAVSMKYYKVNETEILIPEAYGNIQKSRLSNSSSKRNHWDKDSLLETFEEKLPEQFSACQKLFDYCDNNADNIRYGRGISPSFNPSFNKVIKPELKTASILTLYSDGNLIINYGWLGDEYRKKFKQILEEKESLREYKGNPKDKDNRPAYNKDQWSENIDHIITSITKVVEDT